MAVTVICPNLKCRSVLQVPDGVRGKTVRCGACGRNFVVPQPPATKPAPAPHKQPATNEPSA